MDTNKEKNILRISEIIAGATGLVLIFSVMYLYGFSISSGFNFLTYVNNINDYFYIFAKNLTLFSYVWIVSLLITLYEKDTKKDISEEMSYSSLSLYYRNICHHPFLYVIKSIIVLLASFFFIYYKLFLKNFEPIPIKIIYIIYFLSLIFLWITLFGWYLKHNFSKHTYSRKIIILFILIPVFIIASFSLGLFKGDDTKSLNELTQIITLDSNFLKFIKSGNTPDATNKDTSKGTQYCILASNQIAGQILMQLDKYVIVKEFCKEGISNNIDVIPVSKIVNISEKIK